MKIVVTGATGLIGSNLVHAFMADENNHVIAVSRSESKLRQIFEPYLAHENFEYVVQDFTQPFALADLMYRKNRDSVDFIFHAASPISGDTIARTPLSIIRPNINAVQCLLDGLVQQEQKNAKKGRIVVFSSATVYGSGNQNNSAVTEEQTAIAENLDAVTAAYSESKRMVEVITHAYIREYGVDAVIARPSYVYGYTMFPPNTAFYSFIKTALSGNDILMNKAGLSKRDNIYVDDVVKGLLLIAQKGVTGESYNISCNTDLDNYAAIDEIASIIADIASVLCNRKISLSYKEQSTVARPQGVRLDYSKLAQLGWKPCVSLHEGIETVLKLYNADGKNLNL